MKKRTVFRITALNTKFRLAELNQTATLLIETFGLSVWMVALNYEGEFFWHDYKSLLGYVNI